MKEQLNTLQKYFIALITAVIFAAAPPGLLYGNEPAAAPSLAADPAFYIAQGAHFEYNYENWEISGRFTDDTGRSCDFMAVFFKNGSVFMLIRHGMAALYCPDTGYVYTSFAPPSLSQAAIDALRKRLIYEPGNQSISAAIARIENKETPNFTYFDREPVVLRNSLFIDYPPHRLERVAAGRFLYSFFVNVGGSELALALETAEEPVRLDVPVGANGFLSGYTMPALNVRGALIGPDHKVAAVSGTARMLHFWGAPNPAAFGKYSLISMTLDNGISFETYHFYNNTGAPVSQRTVLFEKNKAPREDTFTIGETAHWRSEVSWVEYPTAWKVSGSRVSGEIKLDDTLHELSVQEGAGAFYAGPCSFTGTYGKKPKPVTGKGVCRLVAPETPPPN